MDSPYFWNMNKKIRWILVVMTVAIIGVLAFQVGWLINTYNSRSSAFKQSASDALQKAIEDEKAIKTIHNMSEMVWFGGDDEPIITRHSPNNIFFESTGSDANINMLKISSPKTIISADSLMTMDIKIDSDSMFLSQSFVYGEDIEEFNVASNIEIDTDFDIDGYQDHFFDFEENAVIVENLAEELEYQDKAIDEMVRSVVVKFGMPEIKEDRLDSIYKVQLFDRGILASYSMEINEKDSLKSGYADSLILVQPVNRFRHDDRVVQVAFPDFRRYILGEMWLNVAGSFLLVAIVVFIMIFMLSTILRQKKISDMKNDFINNMTHELKTPVAAVSAALEGMEKFNVLDDPKKTHEYITMSQNELSRLTGMIEKVLSVARREKEGLRIHDEPFDIYDVACGLVKTYQMRHQKVEFSCMCPKEFLVDMDRMHITNLINNLIDNAVKYNLNKDHKTVDVNIFSHKGNIVIEVKDNGPGIPSQYQKYLFDKFYRVPTGNVHNVKGFGLGLNYVAAVTEHYNGKVELESEEGKGSLFTIIIPDTTHG